jgi:ketosteroid isomerase-like protein
MLVAAMVVAVSGCAALAPKAPEEAVKERAQARWDALVKGDFVAAYAYLSPGSRAVQQEADYVNSLRRNFWKAARVEKATCTEQRCEVDASIEYEFAGRHTTTPLRETWIREGSEWWYVAR